MKKTPILANFFDATSIILVGESENEEPSAIVCGWFFNVGTLPRRNYYLIRHPNQVYMMQGLLLTDFALPRGKHRNHEDNYYNHL